MMRHIILVGLVLLLSACTDKKPVETPEETLQTYQVEKKSVTTPLYFSGTIKPLNISVVVSPTEGTVVEKCFEYGQQIKKGQKLLVIESEKLQQDFQSALSDYLKAVDEYSKARRRHEGSKELRSLGFISENDYFSDKTAMEEAYFSLQKNRMHLKATVNKLAIKEDLENFDLTNTKVVDALLQKKQNKITLYAKASGIALYPESSGSDSSSEGVFDGMEVKQSDVLLGIGDLHGVAVKVEVNEIDVNQIKPNQKATITGTAFPGITLSGYVDSIDAQAASSNSGNLPTFPIRVVIPEITESQRQTIHVGMSAKVKVDLTEDNVLMVPIAAVTQQRGMSKVTIQLADGSTKDSFVVTGKTTPTEIAIKQGLEPGDTLVYPH